jgi:hypothetical protein
VDFLAPPAAVQKVWLLQPAAAHRAERVELLQAVVRLDELARPAVDLVQPAAAQPDVAAGSEPLVVAEAVYGSRLAAARLAASEVARRAAVRLAALEVARPVAAVVRVAALLLVEEAVPAVVVRA